MNCPKCHERNCDKTSTKKIFYRDFNETTFVCSDHLRMKKYDSLLDMEIEYYLQGATTVEDI